MEKKYLYKTLLFLFFSLSINAQESKDLSGTIRSKDQNLDNLDIYPNPSGSGKVYITSKTSTLKELEIEVYDVLGKRVIQTTIATKELNISSLAPGVYVIKITEGEQHATRKLIVK